MVSEQEKEKKYEKEFNEVKNKLQNKDFLPYYEFLRIKHYKSTTFSIEDEESVKEKTLEAFKNAEENKIKEAIKILSDVHPKGLDGVSIPTASTILSMRFPDKFAIIDSNAIWGLFGKKLINKETKDIWLKGNKYRTNLDIYECYIEILTKNKGEKSLREFEFDLYKLGKKIKP